MPRFGSRSKREIETLDWRLALVLRVAIKLYDFSVLEGYRSRARQNTLRAAGKSQLSWPNSKHNSDPSVAVDLAPYPIDWDDRERFYLLAGIILAIGWIVGSPLGFRLRWGGDWDSDWEMRDQNFDDLGHFELVETD